LTTQSHCKNHRAPFGGGGGTCIASPWTRNTRRLRGGKRHAGVHGTLADSPPRRRLFYRGDRAHRWCRRVPTAPRVDNPVARCTTTTPPAVASVLSSCWVGAPMPTGAGTRTRPRWASASRRYGSSHHGRARTPLPVPTVNGASSGVRMRTIP
jgi:hypothetical protein